MKLLLDTCSFLGAIGDSASLSEHARELFTDPGDDLYLSAVSTWEISVEHALGKLPLSEPPDRLIPEMRKRHGVSPLPLEEVDTLHLTRLPSVHRDPFDRMLVCQALVRGLPILTPDAAIASYPVRTLW